MVLLLSIESFAAVVSDNDGSAFITKAEFDSLKNNFQNQIDQYNTSIDSKIDGAIASYLAGIKTVVSEPSKVLVDNYSDMMWVRDYKVYGRWKKWTSNTAMTSNMTNSWFTPSMNEKRHNFRQSNVEFYSILRFAYSLSTAYFTFIPSSLSNGISIARTAAWQSQDGDIGVGVLGIHLSKNSDGVWLAQAPVNVFNINPYAFSKPHMMISSDLQQWVYSEHRWFPNSLTIQSKGANDIIKYQMKVDAKSGSSSYTFVDTLTPDNTSFPGIWSWTNQGGDGNNKFATQTNVYSTATTTNNYFNTGCTWHAFSSYSQQKNFFTRMMLGLSNTQQTNAMYVNGYEAEFGDCDFSKSTSSATMQGTIDSISFHGKMHNITSDGIGTQKKTVTVNCSFSVPHWPTEYLRNLTTGYFVYNNAGLKFGEGMPLRIDNQTNGYLQIQFDSQVIGIISGEQQSEQNLRIDMRKENFLSTTTNWAQGYKGLVNPDSTSEPLVTLNGYKYTTTDGKIKLTVPMKKDESLWIRIAPWNETAGWAAKWSNLSMTMNTN